LSGTTNQTRRGDAVGKQISRPASKIQKVCGQLRSPKSFHGLLQRTCLTCSSYHAVSLEESLLVCILDLNPHRFKTVATCALKVQKVASLSLKKYCRS